MENPLVSVIINCYNGEKYLQETLQCLKNQTYKNFEIIFWDNCSTDNSPSIAKAFGNQLHYYLGEHHVPLGQARNLAIQKCNGKYISFMDSDDLCSPDRIMTEVNILEKNPKCGIVCSNYKRLNMMTGKEKTKFVGKPYGVIPFENFVCEYDYALSTFMFRREVLDSLGYVFLPDLRFTEEYELFCRIAYYWNVIYTPEILAIYRIHRGMSTNKLQTDISREYRICKKQFEKLCDNFSEKYPNIILWLNYMADSCDAKTLLFNGKNDEVNKLMRPYLRYKRKAVILYFLALLPVMISKKIMSNIYKNRI